MAEPESGLLFAEVRQFGDGIAFGVEEKQDAARVDCAERNGVGAAPVEFESGAVVG